MRFKLTSDAKKYLDTLDKQSASRIYEGLRKLTRNPPIGDVKELRGSHGLYRLRIGDLRIIFEVEGQNLIIVTITPRGQAYK